MHSCVHQGAELRRSKGLVQQTIKLGGVRLVHFTSALNIAALNFEKQNNSVQIKFKIHFLKPCTLYGLDSAHTNRKDKQVLAPA